MSTLTQLIKSTGQTNDGATNVSYEQICLHELVNLTDFIDVT